MLNKIKELLGVHNYIVFEFNEKCYSLQKRNNEYYFLSCYSNPQCNKELASLCKIVRIDDKTVLIDAINMLGDTMLNEPENPTYELVKHYVVFYKHEVHFFYNNVSYWIAQTNDELWEINSSCGFQKTYTSCLALFETSRIDGGSLKEIWKNVIVDAY